METLAVLIVCGDPGLGQALADQVRAAGFPVLGPVATAAVGRRVGAVAPGLIVYGTHELPTGDALVPAAQVRGEGGAPVVLATDEGSEALAVRALRAGYADYLKLPLTPDDLRDALRPWGRPIEPDEPDEPLADEGLLVGDSHAIRGVKRYLRKVAATDSNVLITGETGTGKELVARLIHRNSRRHGRPLVSINCAAIPDGLLESELFGYERGAFTGATAPSEGKLKAADRGTVFFDEIGDMSPFAQAKILRAVESRELQRLGGRQSVPVDLRVIAATNVPLPKLAAGGRFRSDLFFRLNVAQVCLPPLRERPGDVLRLAEHFIAEFNRGFGRSVRGLSPSAAETLLRHAWPGNVRELRNLIESAFIDLPRADVPDLDLPAAFRRALGPASDPPASESEVQRILLALRETRGNKSQAAERLRWSRMTLYRKLRHYHISGPGA